MTTTQAKARPKTALPKVTDDGAPLEIFAIVGGYGDGDGDGVSPAGPSSNVGIGGEDSDVGAKIGGTGIFKNNDSISRDFCLFPQRRRR